MKALDVAPTRRYAPPMRGRGVGRVALLVMAAAAFGALESIVKGNDAGVRDGIGNLSAPWVIVPLLAGAVGSRGNILLGAVVGLLTSLAALVGFYVANAFVLDLGSHSTVQELGLTLNAGNVWFKAGAMSGPAMGALGAWATHRGGFVVAWSVVGLVVFEPLVVTWRIWPPTAALPPVMDSGTGSTRRRPPLAQLRLWRFGVRDRSPATDSAGCAPRVRLRSGSVDRAA